ncbi:hypothetical protein Tco_0612727 [Tanacetum coccineum]
MASSCRKYVLALCKSIKRLSFSSSSPLPSEFNGLPFECFAFFLEEKRASFLAERFQRRVYIEGVLLMIPSRTPVMSARFQGRPQVICFRLSLSGSCQTGEVLLLWSRLLLRQYLLFLEVCILADYRCGLPELLFLFDVGNLIIEWIVDGMACSAFSPVLHSQTIPPDRFSPTALPPRRRNPSILVSLVGLTFEAKVFNNNVQHGLPRMNPITYTLSTRTLFHFGSYFESRRFLGCNLDMTLWG